MERLSTTKLTLNPENHMNLFHMPSTPRLATDRKRGARQTSEIVKPISSNSIPLLDDARHKMARMWERGIQMANIAKIYRLTIAQAECAIWEAYHGIPQPGEAAQPTIRQARGLHVVSRRAA